MTTKTPVKEVEKNGASATDVVSADTSTTDAGTPEIEATPKRRRRSSEQPTEPIEFATPELNDKPEIEVLKELTIKAFTLITDFKALQSKSKNGFVQKAAKAIVASTIRLNTTLKDVGDFIGVSAE